MRFTEREIQLAARLRGVGLVWDPQPGHYVFDIDGAIKAGSPFQAGVHLIMSPNATATSVGGLDELVENFVWLPTWDNCTTWLRQQGLESPDIVEALATGTAEGQSERESMYHRMLQILDSPQDETAP
jgi:hypothetical protein